MKQVEIEEKKEKSYSTLGYIMHVFAVLAVFVAMGVETLYVESTSIQQIYVKVAAIKWILYAIFFEIVAFQCKK